MLKQLSLQDSPSDNNISNDKTAAKNITTSTTVTVTTNLLNKATTSSNNGAVNKEQFYKLKLAPLPDRPKTVFTPIHTGNTTGTNTKSIFDKGSRDPLLRKLKMAQNIYHTPQVLMH